MEMTTTPDDPRTDGAATSGEDTDETRDGGAAADATTVDPTDVDPDEIELPDAFGEQVAHVYGFDEQPTTYGEWAVAIVSAFDEGHDRPLSTDDLCDTDESPHAATVGGETTNYVCAQDPLVVGLLADEPVIVESEPPNAETTIRIEFAEDGTMTADPEGALLSFGVAGDVDAPEPVTPQAMYVRTCPYGHAFPDDATYEAWATETDGVTDVLSVPAGIAVMESLIEAAGVGALE